ncbi:MAG: sigma-70 family RNA polymerase sigma factor [Bryobacteraceae bacterium]
MKGDAPAWEELVRRSQPVIASTIYRVSSRFGPADPPLIEELVQETYVRLCANGCQALAEFHPEHPDAWFGFLKTIAFSVAHDHFRRALADKRGGGKVESIETAAPAAVGGVDPKPALERGILLSEIDAFLSEQGVRPIERQIFWLHFRHGLTAKAIAGVGGVDLAPKGVESLLHRLMLRVRTWMDESGEKNMEQTKGKSAGGSL